MLPQVALAPGFYCHTIHCGLNGVLMSFNAIHDLKVTCFLKINFYLCKNHNFIPRSLLMKLFSLFLAIFLFGIDNALASTYTGNMKVVSTATETHIQCDDITTNGIGSAYTDHTFSLQCGDDNITVCKWKFRLKGKDGKFVEIENGTDKTFTIHKIDTPENYLINENGTLEANIQCEYSSGGGAGSIVYNEFLLDLKPIILSIDNLKKIDVNTYGFYLLFDVCYEGADHCIVDIEEEFDHSIRVSHYYEPLLAHVQTGNISKFEFSWVKVSVRNKYGSVSETMEFMPTEGNVSETLVHDITYDYHLFEDSGKINCNGTLKFSLSFPENTSYVVLGRSDQSNTFLSNGDVFLSLNEEIPSSTTEVTKNEINWNTHFRLFVYPEYYDIILSPLYAVSDFIDAKDLELLNGQASADVIGVNNVKLYSFNRTLYVETDDNIDLAVYDLLGKFIFTGHLLSGNSSIPLNNISSPFIIARYSNSSGTATKKIIVR